MYVVVNYGANFVCQKPMTPTSTSPVTTTRTRSVATPLTAGNKSIFLQLPKTLRKSCGVVHGTFRGLVVLGAP